MNVPLVQVDAFAQVAFAGNPAAVCLLPRAADPGWMQHVAREMNLSETAFLHPVGEAATAGFHLRWFTPANEVPLCGHATLASAHVLWERGLLEPAAPARFHTLSGVLTAVRRDPWIEMNFPARPVEAVTAVTGLEEALGVAAMYVGRHRDQLLVQVSSERMVRGLQPDFARLAGLPARGVVVTATAGDGFDFVSRYFAPAWGVPEDPVTGSAHCMLAPFWAVRLGKTEMTAFQASARGGELRLRLEDDRVIIAGQAVTVLTGELRT